MNKVEDTVFSVLLEAVRSVRDLVVTTHDQLANTIRELSQQGVFALRRVKNERPPNASGDLEGNQELANCLFTVLDHVEREILLRSLLLSEPDQEISDHVARPVSDILKTRAKARLLVRASSQLQQPYAAAAHA